jgi:hypothetical protein
MHRNLIILTHECGFVVQPDWSRAHLRPEDGIACQSNLVSGATVKAGVLHFLSSGERCSRLEIEQRDAGN